VNREERPGTEEKLATEERTAPVAAKMVSLVTVEMTTTLALSEP
jgi:hypothetical protein